MGIRPEKEKIRKILEKSISNVYNENTDSFLKIEYKYNTDLDFDKNNETDIKDKNLGEYNDSNNDSFNFSDDNIIDIDSPQNDIKNTKLFPYVAIGVLSVKFPISDETYFYTCFAISSNVIVTLASNLEDNYRGGKAISIITSFSDLKVKWENIHIQSENKKINLELDKNILKSKLAVIIYNEIILSEWIGVEPGKEDDFSERDINTVFSLGLKKNINFNEDIQTEKSKKKKKNFKRSTIFERVKCK